MAFLYMYFAKIMSTNKNKCTKNQFTLLETKAPGASSHHRFLVISLREIPLKKDTPFD
jgi:hypothetical protein